MITIAGNTLYAQQQVNLQLHTQSPTAKVNPNMWGIFFEDINFSADGGLYAELVKNRSFEFSLPKMGWKEKGNGQILITSRSAINPANAHYAKVSVRDSFTLINEGFRGMGIKAGERYDFSALIQNISNPVSITLKLVSGKGNIIAQANLPTVAGSDWQQVRTSLTATQTESKAHLQIVFAGNGALNVDMVSLFPQHTWKNRPGGLRKDLVEKLEALKPGFIRFPGGCIVEGSTLDRRYQWKKTVGSLNEREVLINRWNTEFTSQSAADYFQSFGLGFYEYFQLAEDLKAKPLPILNCGMACQFNTSEVVGMEQLDPYVQDALDLIEFANGNTSTKWGSLRAKMGHAAPFNLSMIGIGNEQWDEQYIERYKAFEAALKKHHPEIELVAAAGPAPGGREFDYAWKNLAGTKVDFIDEHYYQGPNWFFNNANRYNNYSRKGPKVFAGEYASHDKEGKEPESRNTWLSALSEAAFMTGLERNADVVQMAAYAPLFAHVEAWQWRPDLIWFDNMESLATPNYYVQQIFSTNKGSSVVPIVQQGKILAGGADSLYASATLDEGARLCIIKLVNSSSKTITCNLTADTKKMTGRGQVITLYAANKAAINTFSQPHTVSPTTIPVKASSGKLSVKLLPMSVNVLRLPIHY